MRSEQSLHADWERPLNAPAESMTRTLPMTRVLAADPPCVWNSRRTGGPRDTGLTVKAAGLASLLITCGAAILIGCGPSAAPIAEDQVKADTTSRTSSEPVARSADSCEPLPADPVIAHAKWIEPDRELLVVGMQVGRGESDRRFEVIDGQLLLSATQEPCLLAAVPLGDLTRGMSEADKPTTSEVLELAVRPLGEMDGFYEAVAFEHVSLPDGPTVLLVHLMREVRFGLTERYVVPVAIQGDSLVAGDRVQTGRDAMGPPVYYGMFQVDNTGRDNKAPLILRREGMGRFSKNVVFELDAEGALRATEEPVAAEGSPVAAD